MCIRDRDKLGDAYQDILSFEKQLCDDGTVIMKFFLYIDKDEQKKRFKKLEGSKETSWRVTEEDWNRNKDFDRYLKMNEEMLEKTDTDYAPWVIIEAVDKDYAALKIVSTVMDRLEYELEHRRPEDGKQAQRQESKTRERFKNGVLSGIDLSLIHISFGNKLGVKIEHNVDPRDFFAAAWGDIVCEVPDGMVGQLSICLLYTSRCV